MPRYNLPYLLTEEQTRRAADLFGIDEATVVTLNERGLLNSPYIREAIALNDFLTLTKGVADLSAQGLCYTMPEVKKAVCEKCRILPSRLQSAIQTRTTLPIYACRQCGAITTRGQYKRVRGLCADCAAQQLLKDTMATPTSQAAPVR